MITTAGSPRILILADDLSGAAECAVACRRAGMTAEVRLEPDRTACEVEGLALDLDSRSRPASEARARTLRAAGYVEGRVLYRKIDSTLRGHIGLEVAATMEISGADSLAIVCPAFPPMGRTVRDGRVLVQDAPLETTDMWRREGAPPPTLAAMLEAAGVASAAVGLEAIRGAAPAAALAAARAAGARAVICDAQTSGDLERLVSAGLTVVRVVWIGSGGMAIPLAQALGPGGAPPGPPPRPRSGPVLVAVGSASSRSREQLSVLASAPGVRWVSISPAALLEGTAHAERAAIEAAAADRGIQVVAVSIAAEPASDGSALAQAMGELLASLLAGFGSLVATGGETARAVLSAAGVSALSVYDEVEPGVVLSSGGGLAVVTKAGAFGGPDSLLNAVRAIRALA